MQGKPRSFAFEGKPKGADTVGLGALFVWLQRETEETTVLGVGAICVVVSKGKGRES